MSYNVQCTAGNWKELLYLSVKFIVLLVLKQKQVFFALCRL